MQCTVIGNICMHQAALTLTSCLTMSVSTKLKISHARGILFQSSSADYTGAIHMFIKKPCVD